MQATKTTYRLITRSNIDGIVSAILLKHLEQIDHVLFIDPQEMQKGDIRVSKKDISVNLPFARGLHQAYDYHDSTSIPHIIINEHHIIDTNAASGAEVIYTHHHKHFKEDTQLNTLVQYSKNDANHTLTTKERLQVYTYYENLFEQKLAQAS